MKVTVEVESDDVLEEKTTDSRGRVTLGSEYANETVTVAIKRDPHDSAECPNDCGPLAVLEVDGQHVVECPECGYHAGAVGPATPDSDDPRADGGRGWVAGHLAAERVGTEADDE